MMQQDWPTGLAQGGGEAAAHQTEATNEDDWGTHDGADWTQSEALRKGVTGDVNVVSGSH
jgi:hypothetical protein